MIFNEGLNIVNGKSLVGVLFTGDYIIIVSFFFSSHSSNATSPFPVSIPTQRPFLQKLLHTAVPLLLLTAVVLLLIEYGSPNGFEGLVFNPELKYVRGPPPL